jgi:uncharacterized protein YheU (UPF0270 family)
MILAEDYESLLRNIGIEYFIRNIRFVPDLASWARENNAALNEPGQLMKLVPSDNELNMVIQSEIPEETLDNLITSLGVRWSLKDNVTDISKQLNSTKKRLIYSFLKEYARSRKDFAGDELHEDDWAMKAMDNLGFFRE